MDTAYDNYTTTGDSMETVCSLELKNMDLPLFRDRSMRCILWKKACVDLCLLFQLGFHSGNLFMNHGH